MASAEDKHDMDMISSGKLTPHNCFFLFSGRS